MYHSVHRVGVSASRGDLHLGGVCLQGGVSASREGCLPPGGGLGVCRGVGIPLPSDTTGYGQRRAGTYPTEMHSCNLKICSEGPGGAALVHPAGRQIYPFEFTLPEELPSSFEGAHGYVRYFCKVTVERPWKFDQNVKKAFSVLSQLDLNREAAVRVSTLVAHV